MAHTTRQPADYVQTAYDILGHFRSATELVAFRSGCSDVKADESVNGWLVHRLHIQNDLCPRDDFVERVHRGHHAGCRLDLVPGHLDPGRVRWRHDHDRSGAYESVRFHR